MSNLFQGHSRSFKILDYASRIPGDNDDYSKLFPDLLPEIYHEEFHKFIRRQLTFLIKYHQHLSECDLIVKIPDSIALREMRFHLTVSLNKRSSF